MWLQIGAGVSLPGVVAAKCGAEVTLSDSEELPQCLQNCRRSCLANRLPHIPVLGLSWGQVSPELLALAPIDIILGSDVFFDPKGMLSLVRDKLQGLHVQGILGTLKKDQLTAFMTLCY